MCTVLGSEYMVTIKMVMLRKQDINHPYSMSSCLLKNIHRKRCIGLTFSTADTKQTRTLDKQRVK